MAYESDRHNGGNHQHSGNKNAGLKQYHGNRNGNGGGYNSRDNKPHNQSHSNVNGTKREFSNRYATAPYNFVRYDTEKLLPPSEDKELYSGTITCSLKALTPLLVADVSTRKSQDEPTERDFFKLNNNWLAIPGSSLKGLIRSNVETLSRSVISIINDKKLFYRNVVGHPKGDYKTKGNFPNLREGDRILGGFIVKDGSRYKIHPAQIERVPEYDREAYRTGKMPKKKDGYLFKNRSNKTIDVPPEVMKDFFLQMTDDQKKNWKKEKEAMEKSTVGGRIFYTVDKDDRNKIIGIGTSCFFRIGYDYTPKDLALGCGKVRKNHDTDFSLHLFGCANKDEAFKGKVSVEPAYFSSPHKSKELTCILGTPHATDLLHYLCQPKALPQGNRTDALANYNNEKSVLRGRKFYWHRDPEKEEEITNLGVASKLKPIEKGSETTFVVHLDKINITELGVILKVLKHRDGHALKLGAGKSVGYGSVEIDIVKTDIRDVSKKYLSIRDRLLGREENSLSQSDLNKAVKAFEKHALMEGETSFEDQQYVKEYYTMTDFKHKPKNDLTKMMQLNTGNPNYARSKAMLLDPISVAKGNQKKVSEINQQNINKER